MLKLAPTGNLFDRKAYLLQGDATVVVGAEHLYRGGLESAEEAEGGLTGWAISVVVSVPRRFRRKKNVGAFEDAEIIGRYGKAAGLIGGRAGHESPCDEPGHGGSDQEIDA